MLYRPSISQTDIISPFLRHPRLDSLKSTCGFWYLRPRRQEEFELKPRNSACPLTLGGALSMACVLSSRVIRFHAENSLCDSCACCVPDASTMSSPIAPVRWGSFFLQDMYRCKATWLSIRSLSRSSSGRIPLPQQPREEIICPVLGFGQNVQGFPSRGCVGDNSTLLSPTRVYWASKHGSIRRIQSRILSI